MKRFLVLFFFLPVIFWAGCSGCGSGKDAFTDRALTAIPPNSAAITAINLPALLEKANYDAIKKMESFQFLLKNAPEESELLATVMKDLANSGVDLQKNAYWTVQLDENNLENLNHGILFNLASEKDFSNFARSFRSAKPLANTSVDGVSLNETTVLSWQDGVGLLVLGEAAYRQTALVEQFFTTPEPAAEATIAPFYDLLKEPHDITSWFNSDPIAAQKGAKMVLSMVQLPPDALEDNTLSGHLDFLQGEIKAEGLFQWHPAIAEEFKGVFGAGMSADFVNYLPEKNLKSNFSLALDVTQMVAILEKRPQVKSFINFFLKSYQLSIPKIAAIMDGQMMFATYTGNVNNRTQGIVAINANQPEEVLKLLGMAEQKELVEKVADNRYKISPSLSATINRLLPVKMDETENWQISLNNKMLVIATDSEVFTTAENSNNKVAEAMAPLIQNNPLSLYIDFPELQRTGLTMPGMDALEDMEGVIKNNQLDISIHLLNETENSLYSILKALDQDFMENREKAMPIMELKS